jgi:hypothetical protein
MYTLAFYETMCVQPSTYTLPQLNLDNINALHLHMGVHNIPAKPKPVDNPLRRQKQENMENWKKREEFKATVIAKKEGYENLLGELKKFLNKLTTANYDTQVESIIETVKSIIALDDDDEKIQAALTQTTEVILQVACSNKYYSALYAKLYMRLVDIHEQFLEEKGRVCDKFLNALQEIEIVDPNVDYDRFCAVNKKNDERRAMMLYIINLYKTSGCSIAELSSVVIKIDEMIHNRVSESSFIEYTNELTEIMNIFVTNMVTEIKSNKEWVFVKDRIVDYSKYKTKDYPGMSSRTIFKYMDMVDLFK